jgi:uncharacterized protein YbjT (DUF2867 family)
MSTPFEAGMSAETHQGVTMADAAKAAGVHLVYTSVANADKATGIPHFDSKYAVEKHITEIGARATIIAPAGFMENAVDFTRDQLKQGVFAVPLTAKRKLAQIALTDIASFAVQMLEQRDRFLGKRFDIAGDEVNGEEAAEILSRVTGRSFAYFQVPMDMIRQINEDMVAMYEYFERTGYEIDVARLRRDFPEIGWHSFEAWAKTLNWEEILAG